MITYSMAAQPACKALFDPSADDLDPSIRSNAATAWLAQMCLSFNVSGLPSGAHAQTRRSSPYELRNPGCPYLSTRPLITVSVSGQGAKRIWRVRDKTVPSFGGAEKLASKSWQFVTISPVHRSLAGPG